MPPPRSILIERFKRLPRRSNDTWQGGLVRARTFIEKPDMGVRRPWAAVWVSLATGMINVQFAEGDADDELGPPISIEIAERTEPGAEPVTWIDIAREAVNALGDLLRAEDLA